MRRPYLADISVVRCLAILLASLAVGAPASAGTPRFALLDLHDLARPSRNAFGDVHASRTRPPAPLVVRCGSGCRLGAGWLGFTGRVGPAAGEVVSASAAPGPIGWSLRLTLSERGRAAWARFARGAARRERREGVPDVLAVAVGGRVLAVPFTSQVAFGGRQLDLPGFTRAGARLAAKSF
jgi:hypothetical protein